MSSKLYLLPLLFIFVSSCKKSSTTDPATKVTSVYKIEVVSGDNQTDTIGKMLPKAVEVRVTKAGLPAKNLFFRVEYSGCSNNNGAIYNTIGLGLNNFKYNWLLQGLNTKQVLKVVLLDSVKHAIDSINVNATGIIPTHGWYIGSCAFDNNLPSTLSKTPSGRILAGYNSPGYIYYSDDNGTSWHPFTSFPSYKYVHKVLSISATEIITGGDLGINYSKDNGLTWEDRTVPATKSDLLSNNIQDMYYSKSGKLYFLGYDIYMSADKGVTWKKINGDIPSNNIWRSIREKNNGDIYVVTYSGGLFTSANGGTNWRLLNNQSFNISSLYIDDNNDFYAGVGSGVYRSRDNGVSWTGIYTAPKLAGFAIETLDISKQNNMFYFNAYGVFKTADFVTVKKVAPDNIEARDSYITTDNGGIILGGAFFGNIAIYNSIIYYKP
jgi:photosystem II stability/assembly factor-like uncharacterized protein